MKFGYRNQAGGSFSHHKTHLMFTVHYKLVIGIQLQIGSIRIIRIDSSRNTSSGAN